MTTKAAESYRQYLERLTTSSQSDDHDDAVMANLLHRMGFPNAVVTCGIVYLEGRGTVDAPPCSIVTMAGIILKRGKA